MVLFGRSNRLIAPMTVDSSRFWAVLPPGCVGSRRLIPQAGPFPRPRRDEFVFKIEPFARDGEGTCYTAAKIEL